MDAPCSDLEHTNGENFENLLFDFFPGSTWPTNFPPHSDDGRSGSDVTGYADLYHSQTENQLVCQLDREFGNGVATEHSQLPAYSSLLNQQHYQVDSDQAVAFRFSEHLEPCINPGYRSEVDDLIHRKGRPSLDAHRSSSCQSGEGQAARTSPNSCKGRKSPPKPRARSLRTARHNSIESKSPSPGKSSHSLVERKYRENLNAKLAQLHQALLNSDFAGSTLERPVDGEYSTTRPARKNDVLTNTITYIQQAEIDKRHMNAEILHLRARVAALEKLIKCEDCDLLQQVRAMQLQLPAPSYGTG